jgi:peptide/nickel transport system substrate-binding protein
MPPPRGLKRGVRGGAALPGRRRRVLAWLAGLLVLLMACVPAPQPQASRIVRFAWPDAGVLTPFRVSTLGPDGLVLISLVYDTLVWKNDHGLIPWLASDWDVSDDGRAYTFHLRSDVTWHDGQRLTADDVAFSFEYYEKHPFRWQSTEIVEGATALTPEQVKITLRRPFAPFLESIAGQAPIIPKHVWSQVTDPERFDSSLGSGPFKVADYRAAEGAYRLVANPTYFKGPPRVQEFQQLNVPPETRVQALQQRQLELVWATDASVKDAVKNDPRLSVMETPPLSIVRLALNTQRPPLDRPYVRQAMMYALDRAQIANLVTRAPAVVGSPGVIPPETPWFNSRLPAYTYDPERARALLQGQTYTLELLSDPTNREPELMQPMLRAVGINLDVKRVDGAARTQLLREGNFQLALLQHVGIGGDPDFLRRWSSGEEANDFAQGWTFHDPEFLSLAEQQVATLDQADRKQLVFRMQSILADQLPTIPLYYRRFYWAYDNQAYTPMNTWGGLMDGLPFVQNKLSFLR